MYDIAAVEVALRGLLADMPGEGKIVVLAVMSAGQPGDTGRPALSKREIEVAGLVRKGLTNQQIARRLGITPHTVNHHLRGIFKKLDIVSRVQLAALEVPEWVG
ncbi:helix-turn-helix domain-containing protein [Dactylosporangium sp. CA-052675]|uniref:helix-turn-helix domain-containing protein n=1 Tax=Dactylosporangium sp. CA-052675 TaxID=3239927 RepID=UPI003D93F0DF